MKLFDVKPVDGPVLTGLPDRDETLLLSMTPKPGK